MTSLPSSYPPVTNGGIVTSWLPITTAWPSTAACSTLVWEGYPPYQVIFDPGYGIYVDRDLECLPLAATLWWEQPHTDLGTTTFSLGPIVCPQAYTTASTSVQDESTFVACCPSGYSFLGSYPVGTVSECASTITAGQKFSLILYETGTIAGEAESVWATTVSTAKSATTIAAIHLNGWNFVPSTSSTSFPPSTTASSPSSSSSSTITSPPPATTSNDDTDKNIGIGVGVSLGTIGILSILFAIWYIRKKRKQHLTAPVPGVYTAARHPQLLADHGGDPLYEMASAKWPPATREMEASHRINELPTAWK